MNVGRVEGHQQGVELEAAHRFEKNGRVVMAGQAQEANPASRAGFDQRLQGAPLAEDNVELVLRAQVVELPEVQIIGVQTASVSSRSRRLPSRLRSCVLEAKKMCCRRPPSAAP